MSWKDDSFFQANIARLESGSLAIETEDNRFKTRWLVATPGSKMVTYDPFSIGTDLLYDFVNLFDDEEPNEKSTIDKNQLDANIVDFASKRGFLGSEQKDRLQDWHLEIFSLRKLIVCMQAIKSGDTKSIREFVSWTPEQIRFQWVVDDLRSSSWIAHKSDFKTDLFKALRWKDYQAAATLHIQNQINQRLKTDTRYFLRNHIDNPQNLAPTLAPTTLRGAVWINFMREFTGKRNPKTCEYSGCYNLHTKRGKFCSDKHRVYAFRDAAGNS